jgi:hypothetical protein
MKYFQTYELVDKTTYEQLGDKALSLFSTDILTALDGVREFFGEPVTVNNWREGGPFQWRGYRTVEAAHKLGSPTGHEQHQAGNAFDFDVHGMTADEVRRVIVLNKDNPLLTKITRLEANVSWVHMDCKALILPQARIHVFIA